MDEEMLNQAIAASQAQAEFEAECQEEASPEKEAAPQEVAAALSAAGLLPLGRAGRRRTPPAVPAVVKATTVKAGTGRAGKPGGLNPMRTRRVSISGKKGKEEEVKKEVKRQHGTGGELSIPIRPYAGVKTRRPSSGKKGVPKKGLSTTKTHGSFIPPEGKLGKNSITKDRIQTRREKVEAMELARAEADKADAEFNKMSLEEELLELEASGTEDALEYVRRLEEENALPDLTPLKKRQEEMEEFLSHVAPAEFKIKPGFLLSPKAPVVMGQTGSQTGSPHVTAAPSDGPMEVAKALTL